MSKGLGRVQRALLRIFESAPKEGFTTSELCEQVYGVDVVEKKHRVAVIRAIKRLAQGPLPNLWRSVQLYERVDDEWYDIRFLPLRGKGRAPVGSARSRYE